MNHVLGGPSWVVSFLTVIILNNYTLKYSGLSLIVECLINKYKNINKLRHDSQLVAGSPVVLVYLLQWYFFTILKVKRITIVMAYGPNDFFTLGDKTPELCNLKHTFF